MSLNISYVIEAVDNFSKTFSEFERKVKGMESAASGFKTAGTAATAGGLALAGGLAAAVKTGMEFDAQMSRVRAIAEATPEEFKAMREQALELGAATSKSASEVAAGFEEMAAMGFNAQQVMAAMPGVIAASEASGADMAQVAAVMASTLNAFHMEASEASRVADILAKTANVSAADITDMQYALKYAAPSANALGISLEELSASVAIMTNAGMRGEQAGTTLRMALQRLVDPPKEAAKELDKLGISVLDSQGNFKPLSTLIGEFTTKLDGMTDAQKLAALSTIFGTEAASGMLNLIAAGPAQFDAMTAAIQDSSGASAAAAAIMKDNLKGSLEELSGALETMAIGISTALTPAIQFVTEKLTAAVNWFNSLDASTQATIATIAALTAGLMLIGGPMLLLIGFIPQIVTGFGAVVTATKAVGSAFSVIATGPIGLLVVAIGGLVAAFIYAYNNVDSFRAFVQSAWSQIQSAFNNALTFIKSIVTSVLSTVSTFISEKLAYIRQFWETNGAQIQQAAQNVWNVIKAVIQTAMNVIQSIMETVWPVVKFLVESTWGAIKQLISGAIDVILGIIKTFAALFTGDWKGVWEGIKQILSGALNVMFGWLSLWGAGKVLKWLGSFAGKVVKGFVDMWKKVKYEFDFKLLQISDAISTRFNKIVDFVKNLGSTFFNAGKGLIDQMKAGIENAAKAIFDSVKSIAQSVRNLLPFSPAKEGPLSDLDKLDFAGPITDSIARGLPEVQASMSHMLGGYEPGVSGGSIAATAGGGAQSTSPVINVYATYVDREAIPRLAAEVSREMGRGVGGKR